MNIFILTDNHYKFEAIQSVFIQRNLNSIQSFIRQFPQLPIVHQCFNEQIENTAFNRIQIFLYNFPTIHPDDVIISTQTGIIKEDDGTYNEVTHIIMFYHKKYYSYPSKKQLISEKYIPQIIASKKNPLNLLSFQNPLTFETNRIEIIKETLHELLNKIFNI